MPTAFLERLTNSLVSFSLLSKQLSPSNWMGMSAIALSLSLMFASGVAFYGAIKDQPTPQRTPQHSGQSTVGGQ